jgi:hypothetical protein
LTNTGLKIGLNESVNTDASQIICDNGSRYDFHDGEHVLYLTVNPHTLELEGIFDHAARRACYAGDNFALYRTNIDPVKNYKLNLKFFYDQNWSTWIGASIWLAFSLSFIYAALNALREIFVYIAFGKKISFRWLRKIRLF